MTEQPKKKGLKKPTTKQAIIGAVIVAILGYFGINFDDYFPPDDVSPDPQVEMLQTAMAEAENDYLELNDKYNHQVDENDVLDAQNLSLAATVAAYEAVVTEVVTPIPTLLPTATLAPPTLPPAPASQIVKVTADKVVSHYIKSLNKKGFPIMLPDDKDERQKWTTGEKIEVKLTAIKGDGDSYWYEILDFEGHYIDADKVVVK